MNLKLKLYESLKAQVNFVVNAAEMYRVGVMVSYKCRVADRRQLQIHSTCALMAVKAFLVWCFLSFVLSGGYKA